MGLPSPVHRPARRRPPRTTNAVGNERCCRVRHAREDTTAPSPSGLGIRRAVPGRGLNEVGSVVVRAAGVCLVRNPSAYEEELSTFVMNHPTLLD